LISTEKNHSYFSGLEHRARLSNFSRGLEGEVSFRGAVKHSEEIIVGTGHDGRIVAVPAALELVEDAVALVERAQL